MGDKRMAPNRQRQGRQRQRKCIFCGEGGIRGNPMTEEHVWPEWMHVYLPKMPGRQTLAGRHRIRLGETIVERKARVGYVFTRRFKLVCKRCNTTWMSGIEDATKPILIPLLQGLPFTLLHKHRVTLATWIALKVMVTECIDINDAVITSHERDAFRLNRIIPQGLRFWIGTHDSQDWYTAYWHETLAGNVGRFPTPPAERTGELKNMQVTAIGIGHIFALAFASSIREIKMNPYGRIRQLWPLRQSGLVWPLPGLSDADCDALAHSLRELMTSPMAVWVPHRA
jgi:hypothetical protein